MSELVLTDLVAASAEVAGDRTAVIAAGSQTTYAELDRLANRFAHRLDQLGVRRGDRVALWTRKSVEAVAAMQGVLRIGAAYVPIDPLAPPTRAHRLLADCQPSAVVTEAVDLDVPVVHPGRDLEDQPDDPPPVIDVAPNDLAYILYTSGSTGEPKGVSISHGNARAFIDWACDELAASEADCFSNHAPFHFDLSVLDLYVAFAVGARVVLIPERSAFAPHELVATIRQHRVTTWYSVPSAILLMMSAGGLLEVEDLPVRTFLFAGEVFPARAFWRLYDRFPDRRFLNLYGPTETNVCTFFEVPKDLPRTVPIPIGRACSGNEVYASGANAPGEEGELVVSGPTVMKGYWGKTDAGGRHETGDIVRLDQDGSFTYVGRRDGMAKVRGHRVEIGEVEQVLLEHEEIIEAAVVVVGQGLSARLAAFIVPRRPPAPPLLAIKRHCSGHLAPALIVDDLYAKEELPRTGSGKVDRRMLLDEANEKKRARRRRK